jgi:uncharacterized membrane protein
MEPGLADWGGWIRTSAFSRAYAAPLAYIGGSLGTLIGADLLNLDKLQGLGAPIASPACLDSARAPTRFRSRT